MLKNLENSVSPTLRNAGAILFVTVPATIISSDCLGLALNTTPNRSMSYLGAAKCIISTAQHAKPNVIGHIELWRDNQTYINMNLKLPKHVLLLIIPWRYFYFSSFSFIHSVSKVCRVCACSLRGFFPIFCTIQCFGFVFGGSCLALWSPLGIIGDGCFAFRFVLHTYYPPWFVYPSSVSFVGYVVIVALPNLLYHFAVAFNENEPLSSALGIPNSATIGYLRI